MLPLAPLVPNASRLRPQAQLPRYRFLPGEHPHPRRDPAGSLHDAPPYPPGLPPERWADDGTYLLGIDLYHLGYLWEAHEAWEACFFADPAPAHRRLLQALIQLAAAELQLHRGVARGVRLLTARVVAHLAAVAETLPPGGRLAGLDPHALATEVATRFAGALDPDGDALAVGRPPVPLLPSADPGPAPDTR